MIKINIDALVQKFFPDIISKYKKIGAKDNETANRLRSAGSYFKMNPCDEKYIAISPNSFDVVMMVGCADPSMPSASPKYTRSLFMDQSSDVGLDFRTLIRYSEERIKALSLLTHKQRYDIVNSRTTCNMSYTDRDIKDIKIDPDFVIREVSRRS
jgi:hypothetical protein